MRNVICFVLAAALAAAPAAAQNETAPENAVDANAAVTLPEDNNMVAANDLAAVPPPAPVTDVAAEPAPAPAPARSGGGFPWGIIGLVGLIGLMGRRRRD